MKEWFMERRPGWYTWLALLAVMVVSPVASVWLAVSIAQRSNCDIYQENVNVYRESPPTTAAGKGLQQVYLEKLRTKCGKG
jgi:hypothetical protein